MKISYSEFNNDPKKIVSVTATLVKQYWVVLKNARVSAKTFANSLI